MPSLPDPLRPRAAATLLAIGAAACGAPPAAPSAAPSTPPAPPAAAPPPYAVAGPLREPRLFAPGAVSTAAPEFATTFEPDGRAVYFNRMSEDRKRITVHVSRWTGTAWGPDEVAPFSGTHRDIDPFVTHDGRRLYFSSDRPRPGAAGASGFDLWYVERAPGGGWGEPRHVDGAPNDESDIGFVSLARDGTLYFDAFRNEVRGLYRAAALPGGGFAAPERLDVEPPLTERRGNPLIAPDGSFLVFYAEQTGDPGGSELYIVRPRPGGGWSAPRPLGPAVSSAQGEFAPALSPDGRYLFFTSERPGVVPAPAAGRPPGDIYQIELAALPIAE